MNQIRHTIHACTASLCAIALRLSLLPTALAVQSPAAPAAKPQRAPGRLDTFDVGGNLGAVIDADGTLWVWGRCTLTGGTRGDRTANTAG